MKTAITSLILVGAIAFAATAAEKHSHDGETPHDLRGKIMESFGGNMKALGGMASGDAEFNAEDAQARLMDMNAGAIALRDDYDALWPEGSVNDPNTEAAPAIWEMPEEFMKAIDQFIADTTIETYPTDGFELGETLGAIGKNCKTCHEGFRVKTS